MPRHFVTLEYRGSRFHGFQKQPGLPTVQGALESALLRLTGRETGVYGAGRTDAGVHALSQAAAFDVPEDTRSRIAVVSLNALLPEGVSVTSARPVPDGFDPRRAALWREYRYFILNRRPPSPLLEGFTCHHPGELDLEAMGRACGAFVGEKDFSAFRAGRREESTVRRVLSCELAWAPPGLVSIRIRAGSFLYKMARIIAGAVTAVGSGRMSLGEIEARLEAGGGVPCAEPLAAKGLFLWHVEYPPIDGETLTIPPVTGSWFP